MKAVVRILRTVSIVLISLVVVLFVLSLILQNRVGGIVLHSLNSTLQTKIETESFRLSLIRKFPKATVELKNIAILSSPGFDRKAFRGINTDTLLKARSASVDFRMPDLIRGAYTFTRIGIKGGELNLFTDEAGNYNYSFSKSSGNGGKSLMLNFNRINVSDLKFSYDDRRPGLLIKGVFRYGRFKSRIRNEVIDFEGSSETRFDLFVLKDFAIRHSIPARVQVGLNRNAKGVFFRKSSITVENWDFLLTGFVADDNFIDIGITADNIDISKAVNLLPEKQRKALSAFDASGSLKFNWSIKGRPTRSEDPHYDIRWSLKNAQIKNRRSNIRLEKLSFEGEYTNGTGNSPVTSSLSVRNFTSRLGSSDYSGSLSVRNFINPSAELIFRGKLLPSELREFLDLKSISRAAGSIDLNLKFSGAPSIKKTFGLRDIFTLNSNSEVIFNSVELKVENRNIDINNANGKVSLIGEETKSDNLSFFLNGHKVVLSGTINNFPGWLTGSPVTLTGTANVTATCFRPESFMNATDDKEVRDAGNEKKTAIKFPVDVMLDVNYRIDTVEYKTFSARNIAGSLSISPGLLNLRNVSLSSQKGKITGNGVVVQNRNKSFMGRGSFSLAGVDVNEAFTSFHNFGQNFIRAENLAGSLSGAITLLLPADSLLNPDVRSMTAEGKYSITNGSLINFDPVKALSKFISLSELENIKFEKLENDFFIRSNVFYVPQMDIKSSAVDLSVNGKHSFDNEYEYHVKMLLSDILSRKTRKTRVRTEEFGEVEDDGLGRTSIYLMMKGRADKVDVSYDMKAQGNQIKQNIKKEKENLKTIFNEEYGLYDKSPEPSGKQGTKPRFRIKWDGSSDTTATKKEPEEERKETFFDRLFKKN
ncbi:MAG TPA: AsmA-like C-terminal region-containing protein [Bacteroidales bacterium]|jgi:hypothetical protein|nr:AsmA-like C-terminal region-containing protein [Bacteroidales bacterium]